MSSLFPPPPPLPAGCIALQASAVFAVSFGICIVPVTVCFVILLSLGAVLSGGSLPELHFSSCFLPGVVSGMLWNAGNIASIYAVQPPLGFAVGYPVTQVRAAWFNRRRSVLTQRCRLSVCAITLCSVAR